MKRTRQKLNFSKLEFDEFLPLFSLKNLTVNDTDVCFAHTKEGIYAFKNSCPHYSVPLITGKLNHMNEIVCSLHAYRFDLKYGNESDGKKLCLVKYPIEIDNDEVYITI